MNKEMTPPFIDSPLVSVSVCVCDWHRNPHLCEDHRSHRHTDAKVRERSAKKKLSEWSIEEAASLAIIISGEKQRSFAATTSATFELFSFPMANHSSGKVTCTNHLRFLRKGEPRASTRINL